MGQRAKILRFMALDPTKWYYPYDFMPPRMDINNQYFVGYEASARLSELSADYPDMLEVKQDGKYKCRRFNLRQHGLWWPKLPIELQQAIGNIKPKEQPAISWLKD